MIIPHLHALISSDILPSMFSRLWSRFLLSDILYGGGVMFESAFCCAEYVRSHFRKKANCDNNFDVCRMLMIYVW